MKRFAVPVGNLREAWPKFRDNHQAAANRAWVESPYEISYHDRGKLDEHVAERCVICLLGEAARTLCCDQSSSSIGHGTTRCFRSFVPRQKSASY